MTVPTITREWFRDWFGEEYLALYPHRDQREAQDAVRLYLSVVPPGVGKPVLDLACGAGRHLRELVQHGLPSVGLDLSSPLLVRARQAGPEDALVRADMRHLPFAAESFGGLTSFFTSFGYFEDPTDDRRVLEEMVRVLRPDGTFMLDFLNAGRVRRELVPEDVRDTAMGRVVQRRRILDDTVVKSITIEPHDDGDIRTFYERVRLYRAPQLEELLSAAGLETTHRFGAGGPAGNSAPRLILAGVRSGSTGG